MTTSFQWAKGAAEIVLVSAGNLQLADQLGYLRRPADP